MDHQASESAGATPATSREQDAVRLLLLIDGACEPVPAAETQEEALATAVGVVRGQVLLQKLDFWLRNPDYLANELLGLYETSHEQALLDHAISILESEEPEVRRYPMLRHYFGAYEPLDDALAVLRSVGLLVRRRRGTIEHVRQHDYYLLARGRRVAREIVSTEPAFEYYVKRAALVLELACGRGGSKLRDQQYLQREYAEAALGTRIGAVSQRVRDRLARLRAEAELAGVDGDR